MTTAQQNALLYIFARDGLAALAKSHPRIAKIFAPALERFRQIALRSVVQDAVPAAIRPN
jgi:hypothetical protein